MRSSIGRVVAACLILLSPPLQGIEETDSPSFYGRRSRSVLPGKIDGLWEIEDNGSQIRITCLIDFGANPPLVAEGRYGGSQGPDTAPPPIGSSVPRPLEKSGQIYRRCQGVVTKAVNLRWLRSGSVVFVVTDPNPADATTPYEQEPWDRARMLRDTQAMLMSARPITELLAPALANAEMMANNTVDSLKEFRGVEFPGNQPGGVNRELVIAVRSHDYLHYRVTGELTLGLVRIADHARPRWK